MRKRVLGVLAAAVVTVVFHSVSLGAPWAVVAGVPTSGPKAFESAIWSIDLGPTPPVAYGPLLVGELGFPGAFALDIQVLPDGKTILLSVFGEATVFRIDMTNPVKPVVTGSVFLTIPHQGALFAEDIALTTDGKLALVTDGGLATGLSFIDLDTFSLNTTQDLGGRQAQAVAVAPGTDTVLLADFLNGAVHYGVINDNERKLVNIQSIQMCDGPIVKGVCTGNLGSPLNIGVTPDGRTALVCDALNGLVNVLDIKSRGVVEPGDPFFLWGLSGTPTFDPAWNGKTGGQQSVAFSPDGDLAYVLSTLASAKGKPLKNRLSLLQITGPGNAAVVLSEAAQLASKAQFQLFGVDVLSVSKDGTKAVAGNPSPTVPATRVSVVDLGTFAVTAVSLRNKGIPFGAAFLE